MSISALASGSAATSLVSQFNKAGSSTDSASIGGAGSAPLDRPADGGGFLGAIASALAGIGVTAAGASATSASSASGDGTPTDATSSSAQAKALSSFLNNLMSSLHQHDGQAGAATDSSSGATASTAAPAHAHGGHKHGHGGGKMESDLNSLIQSLASGSSATAGSSTGSSVSSASSVAPASTDVVGATASTAATDGSTSKLEASFESLLTAMGSRSSGDSNARLTSFLQALSSKLGGTGATGNLVNTTA